MKVQKWRKRFIIVLCGAVLLAAAFLAKLKAENKEEEIMDRDYSVNVYTSQTSMSRL